MYKKYQRIIIKTLTFPPAGMCPTNLTKAFAVPLEGRGTPEPAQSPQPLQPSQPSQPSQPAEVPVPAVTAAVQATATVAAAKASCRYEVARGL